MKIFDKEITLSVNFNGKIQICTVTKYTTCDDVTEMMLYSSSGFEKAENYALFETAHSIERMLPRKSSVLKVVRSWGSTKENVRLLVRKIDPVNEKKIKISNAKKRFQKIRSLLMANKTKHKEINTTIINNLDRSIYHDAKTQEKYLGELGECNVIIERAGKLALMERYLDDVLNTSDSSLQDMKLNTFSFSGDVHKSHPKIPTYTTDATFTVSEADEIQVMDTPGDMITLDLNRTFVEKATLDPLNECKIYDPDSSDTESAFYESYSSDTDFDTNVFEEDTYVRSNRLQDLFGKICNGQSSYDTAMRSFMDTYLDYSDTDEGLSSIGSDV